MKNTKQKKKISPVSVLHCIKLVGRCALLVSALCLYIYSRINFPGELFAGIENNKLFLIALWLIFFVEMLFRFVPSRLESPGCQKVFKSKFVSTKVEKASLNSWRSTLAVFLAWVALNGIIGALYYTHVIDAGILVLISLAYSVCDMICILFFCPFQTFFMKNRCCVTCRIYNWDYAMMFTPLVFINHVLAISLFGVSLVLVLVWEITVRLHSERFTEATNACLSCANCTEKLCQHKKQLRGFIKKNKDILILKGNKLLSSDKKKNK